MKKYLMYLILIISLFFICIIKVEAATDPLSERLLYDISSFVINPSTGVVEIKGVALYRYANNYSGILSNIYVYAEDVDGNKIGLDKAAVYDGCNGDSHHCATNNYYGYRCIYHGGFAGYNGYTTCPPEYSDTAYSYCSNGNGVSGAGDCILRNLRFTKTFSLDDLTTKLKSPVSFKIRITYDDSLSNRKNKDIFDNVVNGPENANLNKSEEVGVGVDPFSCTISGKGKCVAAEEIQDGKDNPNMFVYNKKLITINNVTKRFVMAATPATIQKYNSSKKRYVEGDCPIRDHLELKAVNKISGVLRDNFRNEGLGVNTKSSVYEVTNINGTPICNQNSKYVYDTWIQTIGTVNLSFSDGEINKPEPLKPDISDDKKLVCKNDSVSLSKNNKSTIVMSATYGSGECRSIGYTSISASFKIVESGDAKFDITRESIYTGQSFNYSLTYTDNAMWDYQSYRNDRYLGRVASIDSCKLVTVCGVFRKCGLNGCYCTGCVSIDPELKHVYNYEGKYVTESADCPAVGGASLKKLRYVDQLRVSYNAADDNFRKEVAKLYNRTLVKSRTTGKTTFPNSNTVNGTKVSNAGSWECSVPKEGNSVVYNFETWAPKTTRSVVCTYKLFDSYINKKSSLVSYFQNGVSNPSDYLGGFKNSYFIPIRWNKNKFTFNVDFRDLSQLKNVKFNISGDCDVDVISGLTDDIPTTTSVPNDGGYNYFYRPIFLSVPFPDRNAASNWFDWISKSENINSLKNAYNKLEYVFNLNKDTISSIKEYNKNKITGFDKNGYLDNSIDVNGSSSFIKGSNRVGDTKHQGLGVFK